MISDDRDALLGLAVREGQDAFIDPMEEILATNALVWDSYVITLDGRIVGFFRIDPATEERKLPDSLEFHDFSIDAAHQGKGLGGAFFEALKPFLAERYPAFALVGLTVNCRNDRAYRLYERAGFVDTGALYHEGRSGPQHIMRLDLR